MASGARPAQIAAGPCGDADNDQSKGSGDKIPVRDSAGKESVGRCVSGWLKDIEVEYG